MTSLTLSPFGRLFGQLESTLETSYHLLTSEVIENEQSYMISLALPGYKKDEVTVDLIDSNTVTVSALKKGSARRAVSKSFKLDSQLVDPKGVTAKLEDGLLNIIISKGAATKPRRITVD